MRRRRRRVAQFIDKRAFNQMARFFDSKILRASMDLPAPVGPESRMGEGELSADLFRFRQSCG